MVTSSQLPAFTPVQPIMAQPVQKPVSQAEQPTVAKVKSAKSKKTADKHAKMMAEAFLPPEEPPVPAKPARKPRKATGNGVAVSVKDERAKARAAHKGTTTADRKHAEVKAYMNGKKRQRSMRIAPMQLDASTTIAALIGMSKKDLASMAAMINLLNPMSRPARLKMLAALQKVANQ